MKTISVLGSSVAVTDVSRAADQCALWAHRKDRAYAVEAADVHVITRSRHEPEFRQAMMKFDLICPDGMPLIWAINQNVEAAEKLHSRVSGAELMAEMMKRSAADGGLRHFLLGGSQQMLDILPEKLAEKYPGSSVAASYSPPFGEWPAEEFEKISALIRQSGANLIWVGLGCPKQEMWIGENRDRLPAGVYFGIGAAFAFHAGLVQRAPSWCQKLGLEWAYRIYREPKRLWRRYFRYNSFFLYYLLRDQIIDKGAS